MRASADVVRRTEGRIDTPHLAWREELRRGQRAGHAHRGLPRNLGDLVVIRAREPGRAPGGTAQAQRRSVRRLRERMPNASAVLPREGNEVRRKGRPGDGALCTTEEAGEPTPGDHVEGRECRVRDPGEETMPRTSSLETISPQPTDSGARCATGLPVPQRTPDLRSRMRELRTSGSVGAPGG